MDGFWKGVRSRGSLTLAVVLLLPLTAFGTIQPLGGGWQADVPDSMDVSVIADAAFPDALVLEISKDFTDPPGPGDVFPAIPIDFLQIGDDVDTVSRIVILDEAVTNLTGVDWTDYHWAVLDGGQAWINVPMSAGFSTAPFATKEFHDFHGFGDPDKATDLWVEDGVVPHNGSFFPGAIPGDGELVIDVDLSGAAPLSWTFKQFPTPEPSSLLLLAGASALALRRRR